MRTQDLANMPMKKLRAALRGLTESYYYTTPPTAVPAGNQNTTASITINADAQFFVTHIVGVYQIQNPVTLNLLDTYDQLHAPPLLRIQDGAGSSDLFDKFTLWGNMVGTAQHPLRLSRPYPFTAGSLVKVVFQNNETTAYTCTVTFGGFKVYVGN